MSTDDQLSPADFEAAFEYLFSSGGNRANRDSPSYERTQRCLAALHAASDETRHELVAFSRSKDASEGIAISVSTTADVSPSKSRNSPLAGLRHIKWPAIAAITAIALLLRTGTKITIPQADRTSETQTVNSNTLIANQHVVRLACREIDSRPQGTKDASATSIYEVTGPPDGVLYFLATSTEGLVVLPQRLYLQNEKIAYFRGVSRPSWCMWSASEIANDRLVALAKDLSGRYGAAMETLSRTTASGSSRSSIRDSPDDSVTGADMGRLVQKLYTMKASFSDSHQIGPAAVENTPLPIGQAELPPTDILLCFAGEFETTKFILVPVVQWKRVDE